MVKQGVNQMPKTQRKPVQITDKHMEEYKKLRDQGLSYARCIESVKEKFSLPVAHTQQAVYLRFKKLGKAGQGLTKRNKDGDGMPSFDELDMILGMHQGAMDKIIHVIALAKQVPELSAELEKFKRGYNNLMEASRDQEKKDKKREQQRREYEIAVKRGDVNPPLKTHDFTEQLACAPIDSPYPFNITWDTGFLFCA